METTLHAERDGVIDRIVATAITLLDAKDMSVVFGGLASIHHPRIELELGLFEDS